MTEEMNPGFEPLGKAVLLRHYQPERKQGLIVVPDNVEDRTLMHERRATVIKMGPGCRRCDYREGDRVIMAPMIGYLATGADGNKYIFANEEDIFGRITSEEAHV